MSLLCAFSAAPTAYAQQDEGGGEGDQGPGSWVLTWAEFHGTRTGGPSTNPSGERWSYRLQWYGTQAYASAWVPNSYDSAGGTAKASIEGKIKVHLDWVGAGTPTKKCYLRVSTGATAVIEAPTYAKATGAVSANNGIGEAGEPYDYEEGGWDYQRVSGAGANTKIFPIDVSGKTYEQDLPVTITSSAELTLPRQAEHRCQVWVSTDGPELVPYRVRISSGIETSYRKGDNGEQVPMKREVEDKMEVHSAAEWIDPALNGMTSVSQKGWWGNIGGIDSNSGAFTQSRHSWSLSGGSLVNPFGERINPDPVKEINKDAPSIAINSARFSYSEPDGFTSRMVSGTYGLRLGTQSDGSDLTKTSTLKVTVDELEPSLPGISITDNYTINWHLPEDDWVTNGAEYSKVQSYPAIPGTVTPEGRVFRDGVLTGDFRWNNYSYADHATAEAINLIFQPASNAPQSGLFAAFLTAVGIGYEEWFAPPKNEKHSVTWAGARGDACNHPELGSTFTDERPAPGTENDPLVQG